MIGSIWWIKMKHSVSVKFYSLDYKKKMLAFPDRISYTKENIKRLTLLVEDGNLIALARLVQEKNLLNFLERNT